MKTKKSTVKINNLDHLVWYLVEAETVKLIDWLEEHGTKWKPQPEKELEVGDTVIVQMPATLDKNNFPCVQINIDKITEILDEDYVLLDKEGKVMRFRIKKVLKDKKMIDYSGYDEMRILSEDAKDCGKN